MIRTFLLGATALVLTGCADGTTPRAVQTDLAGELVVARGDTPPNGPDGACWARDVTPAVIETEIEQVMLRPQAEGDAASFRTVTRQKMVQDRRDVWFRTPCEAEMTVPVIASLQRSLKARGLYNVPVTGVMDDPTRVAVRKFQEPRGLDSEVLSLGAARDLGIMAADRGTL